MVTSKYQAGGKKERYASLGPFSEKIVSQFIRYNRLQRLLDMLLDAKYLPTYALSATVGRPGWVLLSSRLNFFSLSIDLSHLSSKSKGVEKEYQAPGRTMDHRLAATGLLYKIINVPQCRLLRPAGVQHGRRAVPFVRWCKNLGASWTSGGWLHCQIPTNGHLVQKHCKNHSRSQSDHVVVFGEGDDAVP